MDNEDRFFARLADFYVTGYAAYVRYVYDLYGGAPAANAAARLRRSSWTSPDAQEKAP